MMVRFLWLDGTSEARKIDEPLSAIELAERTPDGYRRVTFRRVEMVDPRGRTTWYQYHQSPEMP